MFRCPKCGRTDRLAVLVTVWAKLEVEEEDNFQTEIPQFHHPDIPDTDQDFDANSQMHCGACTHMSKCEDFDKMPDDPGGDGTIPCSICGDPCSEKLAHLHQGQYVGDECCWDEHLRASE